MQSLWKWCLHGSSTANDSFSNSSWHTEHGSCGLAIYFKFSIAVFEAGGVLGILYMVVPITIRIVSTDVFYQLLHRLTLLEIGIGEHGSQQVIKEITSNRDRVADARYLDDRMRLLLLSLKLGLLLLLGAKRHKSSRIVLFLDEFTELSLAVAA
jgi:hypothetical protein